MTFLVRPELPTASVGSSQVTNAAVGHSAPSAICPEPTYKLGNVVQTDGATSIAPEIITGHMVPFSRVIVLLVERACRGKYCAGQWKDIESFYELFRGLDAICELVIFDHENLVGVVDQCRRVGATDIVLYYSFFPEVLITLKNEIPQAKLYVRTVNAEALQHWQRSEVGITPTYENLRAIYGSARLAWRDTLCKIHADGLFGISEWDNRCYWRRLPGKAVVYDVPYHCPWPSIRPHVRPMKWMARRKEVICLAGARDAIGRTMVEGFNQLANSLSEVEDFRDWKFRLSPGILEGDKQDHVSEHVEQMGSLNEPWDLLCAVKVLAILTPLGFGAKTTIIDALTAGCHVLVHPVLARRLPDTVRSQCVEYLPGRAQQSVPLITLIKQQPHSAAIHQSIRGSAEAELRRAFSC